MARLLVVRRLQLISIMSLHIGQLIDVDLFGLHLPGIGPDAAETTGTVVALAPGAITIRIERAGHAAAEVTVGPGRVFGSRP